MKGLEELTCNLKKLINLDALFISQEDIENDELKKIKLQSFDYYLYISKQASYNNMYSMKNIYELYLGNVKEHKENQDYLAYLINLAKGLLTTSKISVNKNYAEIEDFEFLNTLMDYAIVKNGTVIFNKNIHKSLMETSLIKLKKLNEFSMFVKEGEIFGYSTQYYKMILNSDSIIDNIVKLALKAKLSYFDKLYENEIYLNRLKNINIELEQKVKERTMEIENKNKQLIEEKQKLDEANRKLMELNAHFDELSRTDPLTKLSNRRDLEEKFEFAIKKYSKKQTHFSLVMGDIDYFKTINDTFGHDCGDHVLVKVSKIFKENLRMKDVVSRYGGEEFVILLPGVDFNYSLSIIERLRAMIENEIFEFNNKVFHITMSFGLLNFSDNLSFSECISIADKALYKAKAKGRNSIVSVNVK